jgi:hypothetical protein
MSLSVFTLALVIGPALAQSEGWTLQGVAVNATQNGKPLVEAQVILRAGEEGSLQIVAQTKTDRAGHFVFDKLPARPELIFFAGVNHQGIHYPGSRIHLSSGASPSALKLTAFDVVTSPNPLTADFHEVDVEIKKGALEVSETLSINNPSLATYVGEPGSESSPTTLSLSIPDGFERVTFGNEFNGRHFKLRDKRLVTNIPWTPGKREIKFTYLLPADDIKRVLEWSVNLPCTRCRLCVRGENADRFECNLPRLAGPDQATIVFESSEPTMPADHTVKLELTKLSTPWSVYLRWSAMAVLAGLILVTASFRIIRKANSKSDTPLPQRTYAA